VLYRGEPAAYCIPLNEELMAIYSIFIGPTVGTRLFPFFAKYGFGEGCLAALKRSLGSESRWKLALAFVSKLDAKRGQPSSRIVDRRNIVTDMPLRLWRIMQKLKWKLRETVLKNLTATTASDWPWSFPWSPHR
jgi:hypothetical protein